jgi:hypothetical protein
MRSTLLFQLRRVAAFFSLAMLILWLSAAVTPAMAAGVLVDSLGFESSPYSNGNLAGQQGWNAPAVAGTSTAVVQSAVSKSPGSQAVKVTRPANDSTSTGFWAVQQNQFSPQRFITVDWDMRVEQTTPAGGNGPFFGITAWGSLSGTGSQLATLGADASNGSVVIQLPGIQGIADTGTFINFGQWFHYRLVLDYQSHTFTTFLNSSQLTNTGFVDGNLLNQFTDADISTFALGTNNPSQNLGGTGYIDNFVIRDGLVGDYDVDGDVDAADYTRWKASYGTTVSSGTGADGNKNGFVDAADYVLWRNNLGTSLFVVPGSGASINAVPEPSALVTLFLGLLLTGSCKRR